MEALLLISLRCSQNVYRFPELCKIIRVKLDYQQGSTMEALLLISLRCSQNVYRFPELCKIIRVKLDHQGDVQVS